MFLSTKINKNGALKWVIRKENAVEIFLQGLSDILK